MVKSNFSNIFIKPTPYDLKDLTRFIDATYSKSTDVHEMKTKESFSPSVVGYGSGMCPRRHFLAFKGADFDQKYDCTSVDNMQAGTDAHKRIQDNIANSGIECVIEHELINEDPPIHGFVDMILKDFNGHDLVVEIKTTRWEAFEYRRANNTGAEYQVLQLLIYLYLLKERYGILLYENKNDHRKIVVPVEMTQENKVKVEKVFEWMRTVYAAFKEDQLPKNPFRSNSKICKECPIKTWCFNQPEGNLDLKVLEY
jgi:CRISPR-associated protein Cas4